MRKRIALIALGEVGNDFGHGGGKQKGAPFGGRCFQNEFEVFAETEIEHFIGFIENHGLEIGDVQDAAFEMIAQTPGVPTMMWAPSARRRRSRLGSMPPTQERMRAPV